LRPRSFKRDHAGGRTSLSRAEGPHLIDDAWRSIAPDFGDNPLAIEAARLRLANVILSVAQDDRRNPALIKRAALQIMAKDARTGAGITDWRQT
jgi:hypothetical protein